jgi:hypothetical protein
MVCVAGSAHCVCQAKAGDEWLGSHTTVGPKGSEPGSGQSLHGQPGPLDQVSIGWSCDTDWAFGADEDNFDGDSLWRETVQRSLRVVIWATDSLTATSGPER